MTVRPTVKFALPTWLAALFSLSALPAVAHAQDEAAVADAQAADSPAAESADQEPGFLGLIGDDRSSDGRGVRIVKIDRDSPADRGMLKEGDLVYRINDQPIRNGRDMRRVLSQLPPGASVRFFIDRDGSQKERDVTLGRRPPPGERHHEFGVIGEPLPIPDHARPSFQPTAPQAGPTGADLVLPPPPTPHRATLGVRAVPPTELDRAQHGLPNLRGAVVLSIGAGSPAHLAGIPLQSVIVAIDGQNVSGPTDLARRIATFEPGQEIEVSYYYKREHHRRRVTLADADEVDGQQHFAAGDTAIVQDGAAQAADRAAALEREVEALKRRVAELERTVEALRRADRP